MLLSHREVLVSIQPVSFEIVVYSFFEKINKGWFNLTRYRYKIVVLVINHFSRNFVVLDLTGTLSVLKVTVADEVANLMCVVVNVFIINRITIVHVKGENLNLFILTFFHSDEVNASAELLSLSRNNVVHGLCDY